MKYLTVLTADVKELEKEIDAVNSSDMPIPEKEGLHHFLGSILDEVIENTGCIVLNHKTWLEMEKAKADNIQKE